MTEAPRELDVAALRALAHPIRARLLDLLAQHGPSTATALGDRIGESSGSTSYHLRQLERHGLVHEVDRGTARERWWDRTRGPIMIGSSDRRASAAQITAGQVASLAVMDSENDLVRDWTTRDPETVPPEWSGPSSSSVYMDLTAAETDAMVQEIVAVLERHRALHSTGLGTPTGARRVFTQFRLVPIIDEERP